MVDTEKSLAFHTLSGNFNVGWIMCATVSVWLTETILERYPFRLVKSQPWRGIVGFLFILLLAFTMFFLFVFMQDVVWGESVKAPSGSWPRTGVICTPASSR
jgi:AAT family amino acid transporter